MNKRVCLFTYDEARSSVNEFKDERKTSDSLGRIISFANEWHAGISLKIWRKCVSLNVWRLDRDSEKQTWDVLKRIVAIRQTRFHLAQSLYQRLYVPFLSGNKQKTYIDICLSEKSIITACTHHLHWIR